MDTLQAILIAVIEGLTEYLPISSTAHMGFTASILGMNREDEFLYNLGQFCRSLWNIGENSMILIILSFI